MNTAILFPAVVRARGGGWVGGGKGRCGESEGVELECQILAAVGRFTDSQGNTSPRPLPLFAENGKRNSCL